MDPLPGETIKVTAAGPIERDQLVQCVQTDGAAVKAPENSHAPQDLFEVVKCLKDGRLLLQDPEGVLYVASKLEI